MKKAFLLAVILCTLIIPVNANDIVSMQEDALDLDELQKSAPDGIELNVNDTNGLNEGLDGLWQKICDEAENVLCSSLTCIGVVLTISVLSSVISSLQSDRLNKSIRYMDAVSALAISAAAAGNINTFIGMAEEAMQSMKDFSTVLFPTLAASVAASGSPTGAVVRHSASVMFSNVFISFINAVLIPMVGTYIASATANAAIEGAPLAKICSFLEWVISGALKVILTVFLAYITLSGFVASTGDMAGVKTISALSGAVPVVGGILSNATGAVLGGAKVVKNAVGVFGLISIMAICLTPCLVLGVNYLMFKLTGTVLSPVCSAKISDLVSKIGTAFGLMLAITASCALLLFIAIISCMFATGVS